MAQYQIHIVLHTINNYYSKTYMQNQPEKLSVPVKSSDTVMLIQLSVYSSLKLYVVCHKQNLKNKIIKLPLPVYFFAHNTSDPVPKAFFMAEDHVNYLLIFPV